MTDETHPNSASEYQIDPTREYYISKTGTIWSPMIEVGTVRDNSGKVVKYLLGSSTSTETVEVPAEWFEAHKDELEIKDGESWSVVSKPTLETSSPIVISERPVQGGETPTVEPVKIGGGALEAVGVDPVEAKPNVDPLDAVIKKMPILDHFRSELKRIADLRAREEAEGPRHGMSQYDSSEREIDKIVALMAQMQKPRLSEDRRGASYRYIELI